MIRSNFRRILSLRTSLVILSCGMIANQMTNSVRAQDAAKAKPIELAELKRAADAPVSFSREVIEILDAKCTGCHNDALAENKLKMETVEQMLKGGKTGPALVAGKADQSLMFLMGSHRAEPVMPPADKKDLKPWTSEEAALIKLWIDQGAKDDSAETPAEEKPAPSVALNPLPDRFAPIYALDLSPDGRTLAVGRGSKLHLVEPATGFVMKTIAEHVDAIGAVRFRPDGGELAIGGFKSVTRWILPQVKKVDRWEKVPFAVARFVKEPGTPLVWAISPNESIARLVDPTAKAESRQLKWPEGAAVAFARSPFEPFVAVVTDKGVAHVLNSADGKALHKIDPPMGATIISAAWSAKGKLALGRSNGTIQVIEIADALKPGAEWKSTEGPVRFLSISPDGKSLVALVKEGTLELWDIEAGKPARTQAAPGAPVIALTRDARDGMLLVGQADGRISAYSADLTTKLAENAGHSSPVVALEAATSASGAIIVHQDGLVRVLDSASLQDEWAWSAGTDSAVAAPVEAAAAVRLAEDRLWTIGKNSAADLWTISGNLIALKSMEGMADRVLAIDYSPDGRKIVTCGGVPSRSGEVMIWDAGSARLVKSLDAIHSDTVLGARFSPDGRFVATCASDKFAKVTQLSDFKTLRPFEGHTNHVLGVDWKPDGKQLATAGADQALKLWNVETGEQVRTTQQAGKQITGVRWSATKPIVVGVSGDKLVRFWNPDNGQISRTFSGATDFLFGVATNKEMTAVFAAGQDGQVYVFSGDDGKLMRTIKFAPPSRPADVAEKK